VIILPYRKEVHGNKQKAMEYVSFAVYIKLVALHTCMVRATAAVIKINICN
jgi:hypothetical protein